MTYIQIVPYLYYFFIYSFVGWVWECFLVSHRNKKFVNRGFLYGPFLPIYGFGALLILFSTWTVQDNIFLVFIIGMLSASILEYISGALMEFLFQVRYWDYSEKPFHLHGHICLQASIVWGIASILLIFIVHPCLIYVIQLIPSSVFPYVPLFLSLFFIGDVIKSVIAAFDLKRILSSLSFNNQLFMSIENQLYKINSIYTNNKSLKLEIQKISHLLELLKKQSKIQKKTKQKNLKWQNYQHNKIISIEKIENQISLLINHLAQTNTSYYNNQQKQFIDNLIKIKEALKHNKENIMKQKLKTYHNAIEMLKRNPSSKSKKHTKSMLYLKSFSSEKQKEK